ncbi:NAD(P)H-hydrate dehydratase [Baekduia soli]|uniref:Bifunctional NAD(P)H-hydrate repair enzyme n=1 Tax=Baekduia soli TaxID=496014 RepID=A0A5B8UA66_9ACTN|nr:NAD(P)H-hydrate dehydratase [Baekduia soli]QEC49925.1 NAD(P)H-hydrate dehydratase [Baekduia soli]
MAQREPDPLPEGLVPLLDAERMRATDAWAIGTLGIPGLELMERAGAGLARAVADVAPGGDVVVVCGGGNNGGDGYVTARLLRAEGRAVTVLTTSDLAGLKGDAAANLQRLPGDPPQPFSAAALDGAAVIVDAVLGTGFAGAPRADVAGAIAAMNAASAPVVAADVPSGVDASTGAVQGEGVRAAVTATFHTAKPGLWIHPGKAHAGEVAVVDIGIPATGAPARAATGLIGAGVLGRYPRRGADSTKFASGHVLVAGGSRGLTGAPCLAALGAMRAGAGYVTACVPASLNAIVEIKLTEVMSAPLPDEDGAHTPAGAQEVLDRIAQRGGVVVLGPGMGRGDGPAAFARRIATQATAALVLDADGLNALAGRLQDLAGREAPTVLTPHAGELGRLLETSASEVGARRLEHAREAARRARAIVVLKGDDTIVAEPEGRVGVSPGDSPGLATAGTGDVLSGVVAALLARGMEPFEAACAAVHAHAEAGRRAAAALGGPDGVIASDVVEHLARTLV